MHFYTHITIRDNTWKYLCVVCTDYLEECLVSEDLGPGGKERKRLRQTGGEGPTCF